MAQIVCNTCLRRCQNVANRIKLTKLLYHKRAVSTRTNTIEMPKDKSELLDKLRQNRVSNAAKKNRISAQMPSNVCQVVVVGNGSKGNPRSLYVTTEHNSYLFNCGEGTQRLANEHKLKLSKLQNVFLTKRCSENMSGLVGLALTCQDIGVPSLTIHGPRHIDRLLALYQNFLKFTGMSVNTKDFVNYQFEDNDIEVKCFPISEESSKQANQVNNFKTESEAKYSFLYLCRLKTRPGELLIKKCIELKVPPGPLLGKLKSGENVVLPDGREIKAQDVIGPEDKGSLFIVLECPSLDSIDSLVANQTIFENLSEEDLQLMSLIIHFTPSQVYNDERYQQWIKRLGDFAQNFVINEANPSPSFVAANRLQIKLNSIDPYIFPLLYDVNEQESMASIDSKTQSLTKYHLRPTAIKGISLESVANIDIQAVKDEYLSNSSFVESLQEYKSISAKMKTQTLDCPEVIFLGTGSAVPSKVRNVSAIWVNIDAETSFLMDCGEGTFGQLYRFYGPETDDYLKKLKAIYVSHLHADHHLGILQLIKIRSTLTSEPLLLIIPPAVNRWLNNYNQNVEKISDSYKTFLCSEFVSDFNSEVLKSLRLTQLTTTLVPHCSHSYAISFTTKTEPNFKIVYSGDTQPTPNLIGIGRGCDLLIHEASMEDDLVTEARLKCHSTTSEAINMGFDMNAKFTLLTHFSQRYAKIPLINRQFNHRVGIAFDNMRVRMSDLKKLPEMVPSLKCLFEEEIEEMKAKTAHLLRRNAILDEYRENKT